MNCEDIQKSLSDLVDESVDVERFQEIESHLAGCGTCRDEMAGLLECRRLLVALAAVEPPVNFTDRVMAEVREAARPSAFWRHWFFPLHIKIPLQATALVLIAVLAAYIYRQEPLQQQSVVAPSSRPSERHGTTNVAPSVAPTAEVNSGRANTTQRSDRDVPKEDLTDVAESKESEALSKAAEQRETVTLQSGAPATQPPATVTPLPKSKPSREIVSPRAERLAPSAPGRAKASARSSSNERDIVSKAKPSAANTSLDTLGSGAGVPAEHEFVIRLKEPAHADRAAADRLKSGRDQSERGPMTSPEESKNLEEARRRAVQTGEPQTVWLTIARNQYAPFKENLASLGNIEMESPTIAPKNDAALNFSDSLRIKVTIFPPPSFQNPLPTAPSPR